MALDKERIEEFAITFGVVEFDFGVCSMHVVLLQSAPECGEAAPYEVVPSDCLLGPNELVIGLRVLDEFFFGKISVVEVGAHTRKEDVYKFGISAVAFSLFAESCDAIGLPASVGDGSTLEHMVVAFVFDVARGASRVKSRGAAVESFSCR